MAYCIINFLDPRSIRSQIRLQMTPDDLVFWRNCRHQDAMSGLSGLSRPRRWDLSKLPKDFVIGVVLGPSISGRTTLVPLGTSWHILALAACVHRTWLSATGGQHGKLVRNLGNIWTHMELMFETCRFFHKSCLL